MLADPDSKIESQWDYIHACKLPEDIARMQDLDAAIRLENRSKRGRWRRRQKRNGALRRTSSRPIDESDLGRE